MITQEKERESHLPRMLGLCMTMQGRGQENVKRVMRKKGDKYMKEEPQQENLLDRKVSYYAMCLTNRII